MKVEKLKKYSVFISSHFKSLKKVRNEFIDALLDAQFIPIGMEHFIVSSDKSFEAIKKLIDQSDVFLLILGDEYGSCNEEGKSWTQLEYEYADQKKMPIYAFKTPEYFALEKRYQKRKFMLSSAQIKQIEFGGLPKFAQSLDKEHSIAKVVSQISSDREKFTTSGWERWDPETLGKWQADNRSFDLRGKWHYVLVKDSQGKKDAKEYVRLGAATIRQDFQPERYTTLYCTARNFGMLSADEQTMSLMLDETKTTDWSAVYELDPNLNRIIGAYKTKRHFDENYGEWEIKKGEYMGVYEMYIYDADMDGDPKDETLQFSGTFNDVKPSPKVGAAFFFRTREARDRFVFKHYLTPQNNT